MVVETIVFQKKQSSRISKLINKFQEYDVNKNTFSKLPGTPKTYKTIGCKDENQVNLNPIESNTLDHIRMEYFMPIAHQLKQADLKIQIQGTHNDGVHTINDDERTEFIHHINSAFREDIDLGYRLPIDIEDRTRLFNECKDGLVLSKLINEAVPDTIDERVLNKGTHINGFQMLENNNVVVYSAKAIGCSVVNIGSHDIMEGNEYLILGLIWQIIKRGLLNKITIQHHPELYRLLERNEKLEDFLNLSPDQILLRWFNYHLKAAGWKRRVTNFSKDVFDGENYTILMNQIRPSECSILPLSEPHLLRRANMILQNADRIACRKYLTAKSMITGNPKLNLAFVAHLFNRYPGLSPTPTQTLHTPNETEREARMFVVWLNSLNVDPAVYHLFRDLKEGRVLLQAFDRVLPGVVQWGAISNGPSRFRQLERCNYAVRLGQEYGFSLVGIQGSDIVDQNKTLTLGLVWQLMREHMGRTIQSLGMGRPVSDRDIMDWANERVRESGGKRLIRSFKDPILKTGLFFLDILNSIHPGIVDGTFVTLGNTDEDAFNNARLAISLARKLGAIIFLVPEDIVEVRAKMILTFIGSLMVVDRNKNKSE